MEKYIVIRTVEFETVVLGAAVDTLKEAQTRMLSDMEQVKENLTDNDYELWKKSVVDGSNLDTDEFGSSATSAFFNGRDSWNWNILKVEVPVTEIVVPLLEGSLVAHETSNPDYPSVGIMYRTADGTEIDVALAEQDDLKSPNGFALYTYDDVFDDDWVHKTEFSYAEIKKALNE